MATETPPSSPAAGGSRSSNAPRSSNAIRVLVAVICGVILFYAHAAFIPVALALLFALVLSSPVEALHRKGLHRSAGAFLIMVTLISLLAGAVSVLWDPAQAWLAAAPRTVRLIERKIDPAARLLHRIDVVTSSATHLTDAVGDGTSAPKATVVPVTERGLLVSTRSAVVALVTVVILTLFLLAGGPPMLARLTAALASDMQATLVLKLIEAVRREVGRYYATIALINLGLGLATGLAMAALGMPNPVLWGAMAGVLNFVPYIGSATSLVVLTVVAFVSFSSAGQVLLVALSFLGLATIEGQIVQPLLVGRRLELNPIIVFLALWFAGWFWGIAGIVLAVPMLVTLKVVAQHSDRALPLLEFLSPSTRRPFKGRRVATQRTP